MCMHYTKMGVLQQEYSKTLILFVDRFPTELLNVINHSCWFKFFSKPGWLGSLWVTVGRIGPEEI